MPTRPGVEASNPDLGMAKRDSVVALVWPLANISPPTISESPVTPSVLYSNSSPTLLPAKLTACQGPVGSELSERATSTVRLPPEPAISVTNHRPLAGSYATRGSNVGARASPIGSPASYQNSPSGIDAPTDAPVDLL